MRPRGSRRNTLVGGCLAVLVLGLVVAGVAATGLGTDILDRVQGVAAVPTAVARPGSGSASAVPTVAGQPAPPAVPPTATPPSPMGVAGEYLKAWEQRRWGDMYALLSPSAKSTIDEKRFVERYTAIYDAATVTSIATTSQQSQPGVQPDSAKVPFEVVLKTIRLGEIREQNTLPLTYEQGRWGVQWSPSLIFKDLSGDNLIRMFPLNPQRGSILDRQGRPLATQGYVVQIGVVPGEIKDEAALLKALADYTKLPADQIKQKWAEAQPDWFVPIKDVPISQEDDAKQKLEQIEGVMLRHKSVRIYPNGEVAAHVVGYVSKITAEDLQKLASKGYDADDVVGRAGIEAWAEDQLAGQRGGKLAVVTPKGEVVKIIAEQEVKRGADVRLTIDIDVQRKAEQIMDNAKEKLPGSIVVMDPRDNSILALATYPRFDPNKFVQGMTDVEWEKLSTNPQYPLLNRPAMAAYATGSIFKVIPYAAAMEKLGYQANQPTPCPGAWTIPNTTWIVRDLHPEGHGTLPFPETLSESCNVPFYKIGYELNAIDPNLFPSWIRLWGLGQKTGTVGLEETPGIVPDPEWKKRVVGLDWTAGDAVNQGIGQGFFQATSLQMANVYSTLANRGLLRTPVLVRSITTVDGQMIKAYQAEEKGRVPIQQATFDSILSGLKKTGSTPNGTGYYAFSTFKTPLASKTGSAENQSAAAHAWFAGWAPADAPEALVIVMVEGGQAGGTVAAPRAREMMDFLFPNGALHVTLPPPGTQPGQATPPAQPGQPAPTPVPTRPAAPAQAKPTAPTPTAPPSQPKPAPTPTPAPAKPTTAPAQPKPPAPTPTR